MFTIGVDPHKGSHVVAVLDHREELLCEVRVRADRSQRDRLLAFAAPYVARVRVLDNECSDKNDSHDARSAAIVALRNRKLCAVALEDHAAVLRMLAKRHHELTGLRTQAICRLHAVLAAMIEGGLPRNLSADRAALELRRLRPADAVGQGRRQVAVEHLADVRRVDRMLVELRPRIVAAVAVSETTVTEVYGIGAVMAAYVLGYTGDVRRFASKDHDARYNATAPVSASSGPNPHHRLNLRGNRQINHAIHIAAVTLLARDTPGRAYYDRKRAEGKNDKVAMRALKRRISDAVTGGSSPTRVAEAKRVREGNQGRLCIQRGRQIPERRHFGTAIPGPEPQR